MTVKLRTRNLFKVFGEGAEEAVELARGGAAKDEIFRRTGSVVAVNDVSLEVDSEEIFVVMGLSGSGKSTLVRCLNRLIEPTGGAVEVDGENILDFDAEQLRRFRLYKIAMVFQHFALFPHRSVIENVAYGLKIRGTGATERRDKALDVLAAVGLEAWADEPPANLSGGMQQRVGLARALAVDPEILLMDEPFSALDPLIRREMQDELGHLMERFRSTIVFITHDLHEALRLGTHVAIMKDGRFVQVDRPAGIVAHPADDYVASFTQDVDRIRVMTVAELARRDLAPLSPGERVGEAGRRLQEAGVGALLVCDSADRPLGAVRAADLLAAEEGARVEEVMDPAIVTATPDTPLQAACEACAAGLPVAVVGRDGALTGSVDPGDLLAAMGGGSDEEEAPAGRAAAQ